MAEAETEDGDLQTIRDVLSVHHVPVVASLHWDKLHSILHILCDRIAAQICVDIASQNAVKEMKEEKETELEKQQRWSLMVEERLQNLQQGLETNTNNIKRLEDLDVHSTLSRLDALEEASKKLDRLDSLEEATRNLEAVQATQPISLDSLNQKLEELSLDFDDQNEKLHILEEQTEKLKSQLDQTTKLNASDLEALQQYCRNLRSDFELKFLVDVGKPPIAANGEFSLSSQSKVEAAVAELQNRMQKKADIDEVDKMSQSTQVIKDAFEKIQSNVIELQSQFKRLSAGSRRASRVSFSSGLVHRDSQVSVSEAKSAPLEEMRPTIVDELIKDMKLTVEKHDKELAKVQKDFGMLGRSILLLSGHQHQYMGDTSHGSISEKPEKVVDHFGGDIPIVLPSDTLDMKRPSLKRMSEVLPEIRMNGISEFSNTCPSISRYLLKGNWDQPDDGTVFEAVAEALRTQQFEPKSNARTLVKLTEDIRQLFLKFDEFDAVAAALKEGLGLKAEKLDLQRLARYVKEQLQRPENAIFTTKPLYGYKCMSCDRSVQKLSPVAGEHLPTNRMPPQVLPMLSAERIFALDRRGSSTTGFSNSPQFNKLRTGTVSACGGRQQRARR